MLDNLLGLIQHCSIRKSSKPLVSDQVKLNSEIHLLQHHLISGHWGVSYIQDIYRQGNTLLHKFYTGTIVIRDAWV